jgi:flavin reductase (DIM6/NTAB) family NADH-FMN oxidoreductase RutF
MNVSNPFLHDNKIEAVGFTKEPASKIKASMIRECPVNLECIVRRIILLGSHRLYIGEILETHIDEKILYSSENINYLMARPFVYNTSKYWSMGKQIGTHGFFKNIFQPMQK